MTLRWRPIRGVIRKELREYRRTRQLLVAMTIFPLIFLIQPLYAVLVARDSVAALSGLHILIYLLAIPLLASPILAASAVAGERSQGSLEPVLTTPISREEFLVAKALAALGPSVIVAYAVIAVFILAVEAFAAPGVAGVVIQPTDLEVVIVFTPLLACLAIWIGLAMSIRSGDIRVAQQASLLCCVPLLILIALVAFGAIDVDRREVIVAFAALVVADVAGWRVIAPMFDRERLIRGTPG